MRSVARWVRVMAPSSRRDREAVAWRRSRHDSRVGRVQGCGSRFVQLSWQGQKGNTSVDRAKATLAEDAVEVEVVVVELGLHNALHTAPRSRATSARGAAAGAVAMGGVGRYIAHGCYTAGNARRRVCVLDPDTCFGGCVRSALLWAVPYSHRLFDRCHEACVAQSCPRSFFAGRSTPTTMIPWENAGKAARGTNPEGQRMYVRSFIYYFKHRWSTLKVHPSAEPRGHTAGSAGIASSAGMHARGAEPTVGGPHLHVCNGRLVQAACAAAAGARVRRLARGVPPVQAVGTRSGRPVPHGIEGSPGGTRGSHLAATEHVAVVRHEGRVAIAAPRSAAVRSAVRLAARAGNP